MLWANLIHLSYNMWGDWDRPGTASPYYNGKPFLRFVDGFWDELVTAMSKAGLNGVVLDVGDGVVYDSHPEIAVKNAWSRDRLRTEIKRLRDAGLEPIPKLNFSTGHDFWLGPYARMVSTETYYKVCADLIAEVIDLFDKPSLFHLGMDEEQAKHQTKFEYAVVRQYGLWWRDLRFLVEHVEKGGSRAWVWSDYVWEHPEMFYENMPRTILQSNWYYGGDFGPEVKGAQTYVALEKRGYDQVPTLSNWHTPDNIARTVEFCRKHVAPERLKGFLLAPWRPTLFETRGRHMNAIEQFGKAIADDRARYK